MPFLLLKLVTCQFTGSIEHIFLVFSHHYLLLFILRPQVLTLLEDTKEPIFCHPSPLFQKIMKLVIFVIKVNLVPGLPLALALCLTF